ncbi:hypothetical protein C8F04DRAFT_1177503 [Mycena alexandri]|uniref:Uncharacterized protein n=1 Tax=Mycena alexandri TaxID=1745969 RepID=A0AAD6X8T1_9AGAR|nr:hypothetical protein C8F04DRAFT_1177503 [Mycena alexandri]
MLGRFLSSLHQLPQITADENSDPPTRHMSYHEWRDTPDHIQDRHDLGIFHDRRIFGGSWRGTKPTTHGSMHTESPSTHWHPQRRITRDDGYGRAYGPPPPFDHRDRSPVRHGRQYSPPRRRSASPPPRRTQGQRYERRPSPRYQRGPSALSSTMLPQPIAAPQSVTETLQRQRPWRHIPGPNTTERRGRAAHLRHTLEKDYKRGTRTHACKNGIDYIINQESNAVTKTRKGPWVRTVFPPDIANVGRDSEGHPICPLERDVSDPNDYGSESEVIALPPNWNAKEVMRRTEALQIDGDATRLPPSGEAGVWCTLSITTLHQAENVLRWVRRTEPTAFAYMTHVVNALRHNPTIQRTAGEIHLLSKEGSARSAFWLLTTGSKKAPKPIPLAQQTSTNFDNTVQVYLGDATMGDDGTTMLIAERAAESSVQSGTHLKLNIAISLYEQMLARYWPLGMRISATRFADIMVIEYASPYPPDVAAWYTINVLLSGAFFRIGTFGGYPDADLPLEHYPFRTDNITASLVVSWLIQHGIKKDGEAIRVMEDFARARRNLREGHSDPSGTVFKLGDWPRDSMEVLTLREDEVTPWATLRHGMLQEHVTSDYPECPADAMEDDSQ